MVWGIGTLVRPGKTALGVEILLRKRANEVVVVIFHSFEIWWVGGSLNGDTQDLVMNIVGWTLDDGSKFGLLCCWDSIRFTDGDTQTLFERLSNP